LRAVQISKTWKTFRFHLSNSLSTTQQGKKTRKSVKVWN